MEGTWRIQNDANLASELARLVHEECAVVAASGDMDAEQTVQAIHRIRRATRHLRALARLIRPSIGGKAYREWSRALRDQARRLAPARDAEVTRATLARFVEDAQLDRSRLGPFVERLVTVAHERNRALKESGVLWDVAHCIADLEPAMTAALPPEIDPATIAEGAGESYRRARRQLDRSMRHRDATSIHDWRKRVKVVRSQVECLPWSPASHGKALASRLKELSDVLGEHHDLLLVQRWAEEDLATAASTDASTLHELIGRAVLGQRPLEKFAFDLGERAFSDRPDEFTVRVRSGFLATFGPP